MFKFDLFQAVTHELVGSGQASWVYAYLEGDDDSKWVVKAMSFKDPEKVNNLLQNILITTSANCDSMVPIKGYDIQRDRAGNTTIHLKMPRMKQSLKDLLQHRRATKQTVMPLEEIVEYFHAAVSCLDELAQKDIAHRNVKPSNILIDKDERVYLADLKMVEPFGPQKIETPHPRRGKDEDLVYKAPETFADKWAKNREDLHRADAWSLGMVIARLCLMDSLVPISPEQSLEDSRVIMEQNLTMIAENYGKHFAGIVRGLLALNPKERDTFSATKRLLEEAFPKFVGGCPEEEVQEVIPKQEQKIIELNDESPKLDLETKKQNPIPDEDLQTDRRASGDRNSLLSHGPQELPRSKWAQFRKPEWFSFRKPKPHRPKSFIRHDLKQGLRKGKEKAWTYKRLALGMFSSLVVLLLMWRFMQLNSVTRQDKFAETMKGIQIKHSNYFKIDFDPQGTLDIEAIWSNSYNPSSYDPNTYQYVPKTLNDEIVGNLMTDVVTQLTSAGLEDYLKVFKFTFLPNCQITDVGLAQLETSLVKMKNLKALTLDQINGPKITNYALQRLFNTVSGDLKDLQNIGIGLLGDLNMENGDTLNLVSTVLRNAKNLIGFSFFLDSTKLSDDELRQLAREISENGQNLETLSIRIRGFSFAQTSPTISSTGLKDFNFMFLSSLNGLKELVLDFSGSPMSDEILDALAASVTLHGRKLRRFDLAIDNCESVTDAGIKYFGYQLSRQELKDLDYLAIQTSSLHRVSNDARGWLRDQLKSVPEVHIRPEY